MKQFRSDVMHWIDYDFTVINDKIEKCYNQIIKFIKNQEQTKTNLNYDKKLIKKHIQSLIN